MALHTSFILGGAELSFSYNAGNGRANGLEITVPRTVQYIVTLTNGTVIDRTFAPGTYSVPLPANQVRITFDAQGEPTITGIERIEARTL